MTDVDSPGTDEPGGETSPTESLAKQTTAISASSISIPRTIGHYHVKRVLGSGGMGTVYEAVQEHPRRTVALKVMKPGIASHSALRRFEYESQILARLTHPNIAQVYEAGTHDDGAGAVPYFVMEYIPHARPITEYALDKKLGTRQRLELFVAVCDAIHHGHQKGIIHRDLKPGNVLVDASGQVKIIDFGVARATDSDLAITTVQTDVGQLIGTLQYMSPEQIEADPHAIDARSDVYSLGVLLFELISNKLPYRVSNAAVLEAARIIKEESPTRLSTLDTRMRGDLEVIVNTALEKDRSRRYQTAGELGLDIRHYLDNEPIVARRPTISYILRSRGRAQLQKHPATAMVAVVLLANVLAWIVGDNIVYRWTPAYEQFKHFVAGMPWPAGPMDSFENVRVIRITDATAAAVERLARAEGLDGVDPRQWRSMRRLHGRLMGRLAQAGVRSVTWNITFAGETPYDEDFCRGAETLRAAGAEVVVSLRDWPLHDPPLLSDVIADCVRWGGSTANFKRDAPWNLHLFVQRGAGDPLPSLDLASVAAFMQPGAEVAYRLNLRDETLELAYYGYRDPERRHKQWFSAQDEIILSSHDLFDAEPTEGRKDGDLVGIYIVEVPPDDVLASSSVDYEWVFEAEAEVRERLEGKAVMVGDFREGRAPTARSPDGRELSFTWGYAAGLDMLLAGGAIRAGRGAVEWPARLLAALIGIGIAALAATRLTLRVLLMLAVVVISLFLSVFSYQVLHYFFNPLVGLLAMIIASELAVRANRARRIRLA